MTPPLTPARSNLRDFGFMPLEVVRFRGSHLVATASAEGIVAAIMLWTASWHESPAGSLANDDRTLANAAGFGRSVAAFLAVKDEALHGFVECSDGRLYHPVVAEQVVIAWTRKIEQRHRSEVARRKKWNERHPDEKALSIPTLAAFAALYPENCPDDTDQMSQGQMALVPATKPACRENVAATLAPRDSKGTGTGTGTVILESTTGNSDDPKTPPKPDLMNLTSRIANAAGVSIIKPTAIAREMDIVKKWIADGISVDELIIPTIAHKLKDMRDDDTVGSLSFFDALIRKRHATAKPKASKPDGPKRKVRTPDQDDKRIPDLRDKLKAALGARTYQSWFDPEATAFSVNGSSVLLTTASAFVRDRIIADYRDPLKAAVNDVLHFDDVRVEAQ